MSTYEVAIRRNHDTGATSILLDGVEIANALAGYVLRAERHSVPTLELELMVHEIENAGEMDVWVSRESTELLVRLGWTPPPLPTAVAVTEVEGAPT